MPIRMVEDDPQENKQRRVSRPTNNNQRSAGSGLGGGLAGIITQLLPLLFRKPKLLLVVVVIGIALYFFLGKGCSNTGGANSEGMISNLFRGSEFNKEIYESNEIFEPLADNKKNPLPERVSLQEYCPTPLNQGQQGSCVAWASAYAARTIIEAKRTGKDPNSIRYSPAFMYNQISIDKNTCQGSYIKYAMDNMMDVGAVAFNDFKYTDKDCNRQPSSDLMSNAKANRIKGFQRLTEENKGKAFEILAMKQNLAKGSPCIIGMMVGGTFMQAMMGRETWIPSSSDYYKQGFGGHAMCVVGYDDYKEGGAFLLMNSWGTDWGKNGFAWVRYSDFKEFNVEAYGLYPMGDHKKVAQNSFTGSFALELNNGKKNILLRQVNDHYFETADKVTKGDKFKVEFTNNVECYVYLFGEEKDGSSYVLFPYTKKHSPYCGITGTRLFPRDYSMIADDIGQKDKLVVYITKEPVDYDQIKAKLNKAAGSSYEEKCRLVFGESNAQISSRDVVSFSTSNINFSPIYFVIGVNK